MGQPTDRDPELEHPESEHPEPEQDAAEVEPGSAAEPVPGSVPDAAGEAAPDEAGAAVGDATGTEVPEDEEPYVPRVYAYGSEPAPEAEPDTEPDDVAAGGAADTVPAPHGEPGVPERESENEPTPSGDETAETAETAETTPTTEAETAESADPETPETGGSDETQVIEAVGAEPWERPVLPVPPPPPVAESTPAGPVPAATEDVDRTQVLEPVVATAPETAVPAGSQETATQRTGSFTPVPPDDSRDAAFFEGFAENPPAHGWARGLMWTGIGVLVVGGLYTGAQWYFSDKVPSGTTVAGVDVGGMSRDEAATTLEDQLGPRAKEPIELTAGDAATTLDPADAGLALDADATADELTSFSMNPVRLWDHLFGGDAQDPVVTVDDDTLQAAAAALPDTLDVAPVDGTVQFVDGEPSATKAADGSAVVVDEAGEAISSDWLLTEGPVKLPTEVVAPDVSQEETDAALAEAKDVVSGPVTVSVGGQKPELPAEALAGAASYTADGGDLKLSFDGPTLVDDVVDRTDDLLTSADDAHFVFADGKPKIEGGEPGTTIAPEDLAEAVGTAATGDDRTAKVELVESDPEQTVAALEKLGVKEKVSEFATPLTNDSIRTDNLRVGAAHVNGTLVKPGETFSLTDTLSPITIAGGYHASGIVQDGVHTEGVGGGLSQMATTTYNAAYFAGLDDVEHREHSYWFSRYPAGREATIFVGVLDMRFKNDTPYGVLMQSWVTGSELHVATWSTEYYDVKTSSSDKTNVVQPTKVKRSGADCAPTPPGNPGFSITTTRKVYLDGKLVKDEPDHWTYKPDNEVVCE